jgi:drug/metabolite transporter (DMT)-like permease
MSVSAAGFAGMAALAKVASAQVPGAEIAFIRFLSGSLFCLAWHLRRPISPRNLPMLGLGGGAVLCYFASLGHLPVGISTLLQYSAPAFAALVTAAPAWRSWIAPSPHTWLLICGVAAVSIISQLGMTWSLRWLTAAAGGLLMQLTPVGALAIGALAFGETIHPLAWLGAAVTIAGISLGALLARPSREGLAAPAAAPTLADRPGPLH